MVYVPDMACIAAAKAAAGPGLSEDEIMAAFKRVADYKERLDAAGHLTGQPERLRRFAAQEADRTRIAAAMQRRHAALNIIIRDKQEEAIQGMIDAGLSPKQAMVALLLGTQKGVKNARRSVMATKMAYERRYLGGMLSELEKNQPHLLKMLSDEKLDLDTFTEMTELRKGGKPGSTGNKDAQALAATFAKFAELSRVDLNRMGASIGKLDGWAGAQVHDDIKMIQAGKDAWIGYTVAKLDLERTFPEGLTPTDVTRALGDIYDTIITGFPNQVSAKEKGQRVNPANLAKSLGSSRVLHFKDAAAALDYRDQFGHGNLITGMIAHMRRSAQVAGAMEALGPNPAVMFDSIAEGLKRRIKSDPKLTPQEKADQIRGLDTTKHTLRTSLEQVLGSSSRPDNVTFAKIGQDIRAVQSAAKLGGAVISSIGDTFTVASSSMFRGSGFIAGLGRQLGGVFQGRPQAEAAEISFLIGEGYDGMIGHVMSAFAAQDGPAGWTGKALETFFKWNGLTWWTDVNRSVAARTISAEMGMRSKTAFDQLPPKYAHVLGLHGIDAARWEVIRSASLRHDNGVDYVTPDRIRVLPDDVFYEMGKDRIDAARAASRVDEAKSQRVRSERQADFDRRVAAIADDMRRDVELSVLRFVADETSYGVVATDDASRRIVNQGTRPGTPTGEALRFVMQFKGYPIAFTQRILGRALYGHRVDAGAAEKLGHIRALLAGMTIAGYMSGMAKDLVKGYWPPRDPGDYRTWIAAAQQGGAWGIYGDFLFSKTNRFGGGLLETLAGPTIGSLSDIADVALDARDAAITGIAGEETKFNSAKAFTTAVATVPFANIFYVKPALDILWLNSMREALSPGYLRRQAKTRMTEYGQEKFVPDRAF